MAQHTEGPWTWIEYPSGAKLLAAPSGAVIHSPFPMAFEPMTVKPEDQALLAAAPDLIAACKALLYLAENRASVDEYEFDAPIQLGGAAIAKAEATP